MSTPFFDKERGSEIRFLRLGKKQPKGKGAGNG
jgi:hypothetical protein